MQGESARAPLGGSRRIRDWPLRPKVVDSSKGELGELAGELVRVGRLVGGVPSEPGLGSPRFVRVAPIA